MNKWAEYSHPLPGCYVHKLYQIFNRRSRIGHMALCQTNRYYIEVLLYIAQTSVLLEQM